MDNPELNVVTGAFGYSGKYIAKQLLAMGERVRTFTGHPQRDNPFGDAVQVAPLDFGCPSALARSLEGATTLYNTYWVRFPYGEVTFEKAVQNTKILIEAAETAGVRRIVHISISNASEDSPLPYFRGKAIVERDIASSRMTYAILRPTVVFGKEDILINNIAWFLRRFPVFLSFGSGEYRLQPVHVEDLAEIAVGAGHADGNSVMDVAGPETHTFDQLVRLVADTVHSRAKILHSPPGPALYLLRLVGYLVRDVVLTRDEVRGLMAGLLVSESPPTGRTRLSEWLQQNSIRVGTSYASELRRHYH